MTERTIIPRRGQDAVVVGIPETCPTCRSIDLHISEGQWRCRQCHDHSDDWLTRPISDAERGAGKDSGSGETPAGTASVEPATAPVPEVRTDSPPLIEAAAPRLARYTDDELAAALKQHADTLGRSPSVRDWDAARPAGAATTVTYRNRFGSWPAALEAAGLEPNANGLHRSQPAITGRPPSPPVSLAETAAPPPPLAADAAAEAPGATPIETPVRAGVVEAVLPPTYAQTPVRLVASPVTRVPDLPPESEPDWREHAQRRYIDTLLGCVENWDGDGFFPLCDRVERLLFGGAP